MTDEDSPKVDIDWVRTVAGALAAVSTAVLLSTLGAAGTLVGAALGSIAATVTTALYSQGLARSRAKVSAVQEQALHKVGIAQAEVRRAARRPEATGHLPHAEQQLEEAKAALDDVQDEPATLAWRERLALLPWKRIGLLAAGLFVVAVAVISVFEAFAGKPVSSYTGGSDRDGGTSLTRITGGGDSAPSDDTDQDDDQAPDEDGGTPDEAPATPSGPAPSDEPTESPVPTPTPTPAPETPAPSEPAPLVPEETVVPGQ